MSNDKFMYGLPYSSVRHDWQAHQAIQSQNCQAQNGSSTTYNGLQATTATTPSYGLSEYVSQRYAKQRPSNGGANVNWYGSSIGKTDTSQRMDGLGSDGIREIQAEVSTKPNNQGLYDGSSLASYAYNSALNYTSYQSNVHERSMNVSNQGLQGGRADGEDINVRIPYQPYSRSFQQFAVGTIGSSSSQQETGRQAIVEQASGLRPYAPPSQSATNYITKADSFLGHPPTVVPPSSNASSNGEKLGSGESIVRHKAQNSFLSQNDVERNQVTGFQSFQDQINQGKPTPSPTTQARKRKSTSETTRHQQQKTPPLHLQPSTSPPDPNRPPYTIQSRANSLSTSINQVNTSQYSTQPKPGQGYNVTQGPQSYNTHPMISEYPNVSSSYDLQVRGDNRFTIFRDPSTGLRPQSTSEETTVDPSQVYNRYHEYQKEIEAVDAEHARLAALKADREAAEAAAAALAAAKSIQAKTAARTQHENETTRNVSKQIWSHQVLDFNSQPNLVSTDKAENQNIRSTQSAVSDTQRQTVAVDTQKMAAMKEDMRLMIEKMRDFQTQDPQLFAHVWESVKKTQAPRPTQVQTGVGEDLTGISTASENKKLPSPVSTSAQIISPSVPRTEALEVAKPPAKSPRKRKSRSNAAPAEKSVKKSQKGPAQENDKVSTNLASMKANRSHLSINLQQHAQQGPVNTDGVSEGHIREAVQPSSLAFYQQMETPHSASTQTNVNGIHNQSSVADPAQSKQTQVNKTNSTSLNPAPVKEPSQAVQIAIAAMPNSAPGMTSIDLEAPQRPSTLTPVKTGVLWPEEHRDVIARTAAKLLGAIPENAGRKITAFQIVDMLGHNPSYIELCELIEGIGFKLDRAGLAVALLAAIPAINATPAQPVESRILPISNKLATSRGYQPLIRDISDPDKESQGKKQLFSAHGRWSNLSIEPNNLSSAPLKHSETAENSTTPKSLGPDSIGPHRNGSIPTSEMQSSPSVPGPRRGPGRPRKYGLPARERLSTQPLDRHYPVDSAMVIAQSHDSQAKTQLADEVPSKRSLDPSSNDKEDRPILAITGRATNNTGLFISNSNVATKQPPGIPADYSSESQLQNKHGEPKPLKGRNSDALSAPTVGEDNHNVDGGLNVPTSAASPQTGLTKEMAARKRTFAEIVDLTTEDISTSIEDHPLIERKVRRVGDTNWPSADEYDGAQEPRTPNTFLRHQSLSAIKTTRIPEVPQPHGPTSSPRTVASAVSNPYKDFEYIVRPISRSVALRKSRYNPKTIARDILIASARHPFQRGLNAHLEPLKARFTRVNDSSDLSTFRWDIVDPGGLPVGSANMPQPSETLQSKSSIGASDSSSGRIGLDGIKLPVGRGPLKPTRGGGLMRRGGRPSLQHHQIGTPAQPSRLRFSSTVEPNFAVVIESAAPEMSRDPEHTRNGHLGSVDSALPTRRRGRTSRNLSAITERITRSPKRIGRPPKSLSSGVGRWGSSTGRKVGRSRIYPLSKSKPTGRHRKSAPKPVTPKFIPFLCEWRDCKAELHNLETLRRHIYSVHAKIQESGTIPCRWSKCGWTRQVQDGSTPGSTPKSTPGSKFLHEPHKYGNMEEFERHMEKVHLIPFAWHMGDGPRGSSLDGSESDASAYLRDAAGNEITPSIASQVIEGGNAKTNNARRAAPQKSPYDPALESPVRLVTPGMRAKFFMGTEWKKIKAPRLED